MLTITPEKYDAYIREYLKVYPNGPKTLDDYVSEKVGTKEWIVE